MTPASFGWDGWTADPVVTRGETALLVDVAVGAQSGRAGAVAIRGCART